MGTSLQLQVVSTYTGSRKMLLLISSIFLPALLQMASAQENLGEFYVCDNGNTVIAEWMCAWIEHLDQFSCVNGKVGLTVEDRNIIGAHWECDGFVGSVARSGNDFVWMDFQGITLAPVQALSRVQAPAWAPALMALAPAKLRILRKSLAPVKLRILRKSLAPVKLRILRMSLAPVKLRILMKSKLITLISSGSDWVST